MTDLRGEQNLGSSFIIETGHKRVKYICHTAIRHTRVSTPIDPYFGFRSVLIEIEAFNKQKIEKGDPEHQIRSVGFHFSVFTYKDYGNYGAGAQLIISDMEELARRIFLSYHCYVNPPTQIDDESLLLDYEELLKPLPKTPEEEREREFLDRLLDGTIGKNTYLAKLII
jgi:hypothetical protein